MSKASSEQPTAPALERAFLLAGIAAIATAAGMTVAALRGDGSGMNTFLFMNQGLSHGAAAAWERGVSLAALFAGIAGLISRRWGYFLPVAACMIAEAFARREVGGQAFSNWAWVTDALRYTAPAAAMLLAFALRAPRRGLEITTTTAHWIMRFATVAVFASHGAEAMQGNPAFIDLIIGSAVNLTGVRVTESTARTLLEAIGLMDCGIAAAILLYARPPILIAATSWATIATLSRMTADGLGAYPAVLIRSSYILCPLVLLYLQAAVLHRRCRNVENATTETSNTASPLP